MSREGKTIAVLDASKLRQLPAGWSWVRVADVGEVKLGRQRSPEHHQGSHMRQYLRVANVYENRIDVSDVLTMNFTPKEFETYRLQYGDILLNEGQSLRWVGRPAMYRDELPGACFQNTLVRFRTSNAVLPNYALMVFLHYLHCQRFQQIAKWTVNIAHLGATRFAEIEFPLPPLNEQRRIADTIDELFSDLDAGVAALERVRTKLRHYRAAVLKAAVEGALTAEWRKQHPATEPASALLTRILAERRRRWEQDQLRKFAAADKVPPQNWKAKYTEPAAVDAAKLPPLADKWCWATAASTCDFITKGTTPSGSDAPKPQGEIPFIKVQHLSGTGTFHFSDSPSFVSRTVNDRFLARSRVFPGDVLMNLVGPPLGQISVVPGSFEEWNVNQAIAIFRAVPGLSNRFLAICLLSRVVVVRALSRAKATVGQVNLTLEMCRQLPLPLPPLAEQEAIVEAVEDQLSVIEHIEADVAAKLKSAQALRQSILRHAFTGQLVPQDPHDEPASELLKRLAADRDQRTRLLKTAKAAKQQPAASRGRKKSTP